MRPTTGSIEAEAPYSVSQAHAEASRCLQCFDPPCVEACPVGIVIPRFVRMIHSSNIRGAAEVVRSSNPMAASCGRACPDEQLCAAVCVRREIDRAIEIRRLHRFATDREDAMGPRSPVVAPLREARAAVVGAGPSGLACAFELRRLGLSVTLFDRQDRAGGVLSRTIPLYRFPDETVQSDVSWITGGDDRIELRLGTSVQDVETLAQQFDAVFLATGLVAGGPTIPGIELKGVVMAEDFLAVCRTTRYTNPVGTEVIVIGGGNVAIDAAMAAVRCGEVGSHKPRVQVLYRRTRAEMPAWDREVAEAERSGVILQFLVLPEAFEGNGGHLTGIRISWVRLAKNDGSGRPAPVSVPGSSFVLACDQAILAIGQSLDRRPLGKLPVNERGFLRTERGSQRVRGNIFAGGDAIGHDQTIVAAVRDGKSAARAIAASLVERRS